MSGDRLRGTRTEHTRADMRAIAACPSLIRELESLLAWDADAIGADPEGYEVDQANARAALALAKGEDPENPGGCFCRSCGLPLPADGPCSTGCEDAKGGNDV